ncbi:MAG: hypothetical protein Q9191_001096 [Dirinaria sp. TL-2023a]
MSSAAANNSSARPEYVDLTTVSDSEHSDAATSIGDQSRGRSTTTSSRKRQSSDHSSDSDIVIKRPRRAATTQTSAPTTSTTTLTAPVIRVASPRPSFIDAPALRKQVVRNLKELTGPKVKVVNDIDDSSPPVNFRFVNDNVLAAGVQKADEQFMTGCNCHPENGRNIGCEYLYCECVEESEPNAQGQRHFAYSAAKRSFGCLRDVHLRTRDHIYECNKMCNCGDNCKNRVVQWGRKVPLEIFKTTNRGWGLRCPKALQKGQFIDTYRGEIITNEESDRRGFARQENEDNYLFGLDKFCEAGEQEPTYVIDGMHMGAPTRFINHCCQPNCAIYTVSYNHNDKNMYELAFFAMRDIPALDELTFDYKDNDETFVITDAMADEMEKENGERPTKCLCGAQECRGYFFH